MTPIRLAQMNVVLPKYGAINRLALISVAMLAKPVTKAANGNQAEALDSGRQCHLAKAP